MQFNCRDHIDDLRVHVFKIMTGEDPWILYSHFSDQGHNPTMTAAVLQGGEYDGALYLHIFDICKLKPNFQERKLLRLDIYVPTTTAIALERFIAATFGHGQGLDRTTADPGDYVGGPGVLPEMHGSFQGRAASVLAQGSRFEASSRAARVFLDNEAPAEGHIEMQGPELHMGVPDLTQVSTVAQASATPTDVPVGELRRDQSNPVYKAPGVVHIVFDRDQAQRVGATLARMFSDK